MITQTTWKKTSVTTPHSLGNCVLLDPPPRPVGISVAIDEGRGGEGWVGS